MKLLKVGDHVIEHSLSPLTEGVVVKIVKGFDNDNHGTVFVWQMNRFEYGADNCEHYVEFGWERSLRILEKG